MMSFCSMEPRKSCGRRTHQSGSAQVCQLSVLLLICFAIESARAEQEAIGRPIRGEVAAVDNSEELVTYSSRDSSSDEHALHIPTQHVVDGEWTAQRLDSNPQPSTLLSSTKEWWNRKALRPQSQQAISKPSMFRNSPKLDLMIQEQLHKLNSVLAGGDVNALLRFCAPGIRLDAPGRPGVQGHGRELVFALHTFFETKVSTWFLPPPLRSFQVLWFACNLLLH
jgi:hypothetical protein